jgi:hypothetical protein
MLNSFDVVLEQLCDKWTQEDYQVLLEADVSGWLFHLLMLDPTVTANQVHLDTRVTGAIPNEKYDLAIGPVNSEEDRPSVNPLLVAEVKVFPEVGFTEQQHRVHYEHVLQDDLRKLAVLANSVQDRVEVLVDGHNYMSGQYQGQPRLEYLKRVRDAAAPGVHLVVLSLRDQRWQVRRL